MYSGLCFLFFSVTEVQPLLICIAHYIPCANAPLLHYTSANECMEPILSTILETGSCKLRSILSHSLFFPVLYRYTSNLCFWLFDLLPFNHAPHEAANISGSNCFIIA